MPDDRGCAVNVMTAASEPVAYGMGRMARRLALLLVPLCLAACAAAPDWADPGQLFDDDSAPEGRYLDPDTAIPKLSSVPDRPRPYSTLESRTALQAALAADLKEGDRVLTGGAPKRQAGGEAGKAPSALSEIVAVVYFGSGSASLGTSERRILAEVAKLQQRQGRALKVVGHASHGGAADDAAAAQEANLRLSEARAEAVARTLLSLGVAPDDLFYIAAGDTAPLYAETTASGAAGNRRAEIFLETTPQAQ